jgi:hypothetical protein
MVVMLRELLGELKPGEPVYGSNPTDKTYFFEDHEMSVCRTLRNVRQDLDDFSDAHRVLAISQ